MISPLKKKTPSPTFFTNSHSLFLIKYITLVFRKLVFVFLVQHFAARDRPCQRIFFFFVVHRKNTQKNNNPFLFKHNFFTLFLFQTIFLKKSIKHYLYYQIKQPFSLFTNNSIRLTTISTRFSKHFLNVAFLLF
jgi:hypothetical protein